jgi:hypothetical protein
VKGLFHQANADLPMNAAEVLNMRVQSADEVCAALLSAEIKPNIPARAKAPEIEQKLDSATATAASAT